MIVMVIYSHPLHLPLTASVKTTHINQ